jgi:cysteine desulfurase
MIAALDDLRGHPDGSDRNGSTVTALLEECRLKLCEYFECGFVAFTSGGSEANSRSIAALGRLALRDGRNRVIASGVEHVSVVEALRRLVEEGFELEILPVSGDGLLDPEDLRSALTDNTGLVTVELSSPVSGVVQPVGILASLARDAGARFHCNGCAAASRMGISLAELHADTLSISAHKFGGPPGVGAILICDEDLLRDAPELLRRPFTMPNIPGIPAMTAAIEALSSSMDNRRGLLFHLMDQLFASLREKSVPFRPIGPGETLPGAALLELPADACPELLHEALEMGGVVVPSPVSAARVSYLRALGLDDSHPERYVGLFLEDDDSMVEVEILARQLRKLLR